MDNKSYLGSITKYGGFEGIGSNADVFKCEYFDSIFAYKEFWSEKYVNAIKDNIIDISQFYGEKGFNFPYKFIYKNPSDELFIGYIMDYLYQYKKLTELYNLTFEQKKQLLNRVILLIEKLHNKFKFLHGDLTLWNILYNENKDSLELTDFDTCINLENKKSNLPSRTDIMIEYIKANGIDKDLDIFIFNISCYAFLNNCDFDDVIKNIKSNNFGIFDNKARGILESYKNFEVPKTVKKEYIMHYL